MDEPKLLVVAIDFGSTGAGCAFSYSYQHKTNPLDICTLVWPESPGDMTKVPCVTLFDPDKTFVAFGYKAEQMYQDLVDTGLTDDWYFFKCFKMQLYAAVENDVDVRKDFDLRDVHGKAMSAKTVFSLAIKNIVDVLRKQMSDRSLGALEGMEHYVITVPAIWNDSCKQFMREAAEQAGISTDRLSMVYEPEAASIYAKHLPVEKVKGSNHEVKLEVFNPGRKFIVLDAGGGTIDISTQAVSADGELNIIQKVRGGPWGGEYTNKNFLQVLEKIVGHDVLLQFRKCQSRYFLELIRNFELKKRSFKTGDNDIRIRLPYTFTEYVEETTGKSLPDLLSSSDDRKSVSLKRDKLIMASDLFVSLFKRQIEKIISEIKQILKHERCTDVSAIMMVGGLSESEVVQVAMQLEFGGNEMKLYLPMDGALSVLKGAIIYGHNPKVVKSRICPYTFGVSVWKPFIGSRHLKEKMVYKDGKICCKDIFRILYVEDEEVQIGDKRSFYLSDTFFMPESQPLRILPKRYRFFISTSKDPFYITDDGCRHHATLIVPVPENGKWPEEVNGQIELEIAGTEMIGTFINRDTQERTITRFEFLPRTVESENKKRLFDPFDTFDMDSDFEPITTNQIY